MKHFYLTVDGMLSGTGIRDSIQGGYIDPHKLGVSPNLCKKISQWLEKYEKAHYIKFEDKQQNQVLDQEGIEICKLLKNQFPASKIDYYSNADMRKIIVN